MVKTRTCLLPVAVLTGLLLVCFFPVARAGAANLPGQESRLRTEAQLQARDALNTGVQNFKDGEYDRAIANFALAKRLDPALVVARLYLATAYASLYIPGLAEEENLHNGEKAIEEYRGTLVLDPLNLNAIDGIGSILFQMAGTPYDAAKLEEAKSYFVKHIRLKPKDPEPFYWVGVIDWTMAIKANNEIRAKYAQVGPDSPLPAEARAAYAENYGSIIEEGIDHLKSAIKLKPDYDDAMAYLSLLYRRKADTVDSLSEREQLLLAADALFERIKEIKHEKLDPDKTAEPAQPEPPP
jgi:tetratricopeptide (TPR) repeat protein